MALMKCGECGQQVSEFAQKCPRCGAPRNYFVPADDEAQPTPASDSPAAVEDELSDNPAVDSQSAADDLSAPDRMGDDGYDPDDDSRSGGRGMLWLWIVVALVVVGALIGYVVYSNRQAQIEQAQIEQVRADSIAVAEKAAADREAAVQDSIAKAEFRNDFVRLSDFIVVKATEWSDGKRIPCFRNNVGTALESHGYTVSDTRKGNREGEGGDYDPYTVTTWDKNWDRDDSTFLWSRVRVDEGVCGSFTIEFCDDEALNAFIESCRALGYKYKNPLGKGVYELTMVDVNSDQMMYYHENGHCVVTVEGKKVMISQGCL